MLVSGRVTCTTLGKGASSSKVPLGRDMLAPRKGNPCIITGRRLSKKDMTHYDLQKTNFVTTKQSSG